MSLFQKKLKAQSISSETIQLVIPLSANLYQHMPPVAVDLKGNSLLTLARTVIENWVARSKAIFSEAAVSKASSSE